MSASPAPAAGDYHAVVLAAGAGTRFGGGKLRAEWRGKPLIRWAVEAACASPAGSVAVVTGADPAVAEAARCDCTAPLVVVGALDWAQGLSASLRAGFSSASINARGVFVFLGDMPRVPHDMGRRLCEALSGGARAAAPVCGGRRRVQRRLHGQAVHRRRTLRPGRQRHGGAAAGGAIRCWSAASWPTGWRGSRATSA